MEGLYEEKKHTVFSRFLVGFKGGSVRRILHSGGSTYTSNQNTLSTQLHSCIKTPATQVHIAVII